MPQRPLTISAPARTSWLQVAIVGVSEFMIWTGFSAIVPFLPVFLREEGHGSLTMIGFVAAAFFLGTLLFASPLGWISDLIGRKPVMVGGMALFAVVCLLFTRTVDPRWFLLLRLLEGVCAAAGAVMLAFVADASAPAQRSRAYGLVTTAQSAGAIAGPTLGAAIFGLAGGGLPGFHAIFYVAALLTVLDAVLLAVFIREPDSTTERRAARAGGRQLPQRRGVLTPAILAFLVVGLTTFFTMGGFEVAWSLHLRSVGASMTTISLLWVAFSVPMLFSVAGGMLADRHSRFLLMFAGNAVAALGFVAIGLTVSIPLLFVISVVQGIAVAVATPAKQGLLIQVSPPQWIGTVTGLDQTAMQLGGLAGSLLVPVVYGAVSGLTFALCGALSLVGLALTAPILGRESRRLRQAAVAEDPAGAS